MPIRQSAACGGMCELTVCWLRGRVVAWGRGVGRRGVWVGRLSIPALLWRVAVATIRRLPLHMLTKLRLRMSCLQGLC